MEQKLAEYKKFGEALVKSGAQEKLDYANRKKPQVVAFARGLYPVFQEEPPVMFDEYASIRNTPKVPDPKKQIPYWARPESEQSGNGQQRNPTASSTAQQRSVPKPQKQMDHFDKTLEEVNRIIMAKDAEKKRQEAEAQKLKAQRTTSNLLPNSRQTTKQPQRTQKKPISEPRRIPKVTKTDAASSSNGMTARAPNPTTIDRKDPKGKGKAKAYKGDDNSSIVPMDIDLKESKIAVKFDIFLKNGLLSPRLPELKIRGRDEAPKKGSRSANRSRSRSPLPKPTTRNRSRTPERRKVPAISLVNNRHTKKTSVVAASTHSSNSQVASSSQPTSSTTTQGPEKLIIMLQVPKRKLEKESESNVQSSKRRKITPETSSAVENNNKPIKVELQSQTGVSPEKKVRKNHMHDGYQNQSRISPETKKNPGHRKPTQSSSATSRPSSEKQIETTSESKSDSSENKKKIKSLSAVTSSKAEALPNTERERQPSGTLIKTEALPDKKPSRGSKEEKKPTAHTDSATPSKTKEVERTATSQSTSSNKDKQSNSSTVGKGKPISTSSSTSKSLKDKSISVTSISKEKPTKDPRDKPTSHKDRPNPSKDKDKQTSISPAVKDKTSKDTKLSTSKNQRDKLTSTTKDPKEKSLPAKDKHTPPSIKDASKDAPSTNATSSKQTSITKSSSDSTASSVSSDIQRYADLGRDYKHNGSNKVNNAQKQIVADKNRLNSEIDEVRRGIDQKTRIVKIMAKQNPGELNDAKSNLRRAEQSLSEKQAELSHLESNDRIPEAIKEGFCDIAKSLAAFTRMFALQVKQYHEGGANKANESVALSLFVRETIGFARKYKDRNLEGMCLMLQGLIMVNRVRDRPEWQRSAENIAMLLEAYS